MCCCTRFSLRGDRLAIVEGTFQGMEGQCIQALGTGKVQLRLTIFGRPVEVDFEPHMLHPWEMTEVEYQGSRHVRCLLSFLRRFPRAPGVRKPILFGCACLRLVWAQLDDRLRDVVLTAEQLADRPRDGTRREQAARTRAARLPEPATLTGAMREVGHMTCNALTGDEAAWDLWAGVEHFGLSGSAAPADLLRDVFGNPFRPPVIDRAWLSWQAGLIPQLAQLIYAGRRFDEMPVLADALEDAGCRDDDILSHCRHPVHARGCWVLDCLRRN